MSMRWVGHVARMGEKEIYRENLVREFVGKNYLEDLRIDNIDKKHKEKGWKRAEWIDVVQDTDM